MLLHLVDVAPLDDSDPLQAAQIIIQELEKFDPNLVLKPRWLVFNKIDSVLPEDLDKICQRVIDGLNWQGPVAKMSALQHEGTQELMQGVMCMLEDISNTEKV